MPDQDMSRRQEQERQAAQRRDAEGAQTSERSTATRDVQRDAAASERSQQSAAASKDEEARRRVQEDAELAAPWNELDRTVADELKQSFQQVRDQADEVRAALDLGTHREQFGLPLAALTPAAFKAAHS